MKNKFSLLLAAVMVVNTVATIAHGAFTNPLKNYNLYEDVSGTSTDERERVISDYLGEPQNAQIPDIDDFSYKMPGSDIDVPDAPKSRNQTLRESSNNVYSDGSAPWLEGPSYYANPSFASIVEKYRRSDFAGCLQECISYVRQHPYDTLGYYYLAMCYTKCSDKDNAVRAYEKVIELNDNPMIVKYATNGRNCVMGNENEKCYPQVNEPELVYPYANIPVAELKPVDPETLVNRNLSNLRNHLSPSDLETKNKNEEINDQSKDKKDTKVVLPFGKQDEKLDEFINSPYGNGLSPDLNKQYKQLQLKKLQDTINVGDYSEKDNQQNIKEIKKFDNQKSDSGSIKLAYLTEEDWESIKKDPEFIKAQNEYREISAILGSDSSKEVTDFSDILPYMNEENAQKMSPEMIQNMMMKSLMGDITL